MFTGQRKEYAKTCSGHIVEKISMEVCSLKTDVWYYLPKCKIIEKKSKSFFF
jgi:hypothetical protein